LSQEAYLLMIILLILSCTGLALVLCFLWYLAIKRLRERPYLLFLAGLASTFYVRAVHKLWQLCQVE